MKAERSRVEALRLLLDTPMADEDRIGHTYRYARADPDKMHVVCPYCEQGFCFDFQARRVTCGCSDERKSLNDTQQRAV